MVTGVLTDVAEPDLVAAQSSLPIALGTYALAGRRAGLIIVDEVNGFCTVGAGPLAPREANAQVTRMLAETERLARAFAGDGRPIALFLDSHEPGKPEPPYPPHCERGSGEDELVAELLWLREAPTATLIEKDCINGFIGAIDPQTGRNRIVEWIGGNELATVIVVGICTDICVMDFVLTLLSARNHGLVPPLADIVVYEPGCATYDLPRPVALAANLPATAAHPQAIAHHVGLYLMAARGAILADRLA
ncbi:MAG: isochorismatase family protein [Rhodospirillales bacterium]|jgi:nicotinamidase-related amidase|nr:isochorismatase family protein [Rhodospirillales bacterium]